MVARTHRGHLALLLLFALLISGCSERRQASLLEEADEKIGRSAYGEASMVLKKAIALNPESRTAVKALYKLGFVLETYLRDFEGALFNYNEFIRLGTDPVAIYEVQKRVANLYFEQTNDPEKAAEAYRKLLTISPQTLEGDLFEFRIGEAYFRSNDFDKARVQFQTLVDKFPKSHLVPKARYEIGNTYYMEGKYEVAIEALRQVLRHHPQNEFALEAQFLTGQCFEHLDKFPAALQAYESLLDKYSPREVIQMRITEVTKRAKKMKTAP